MRNIKETYIFTTSSTSTDNLVHRFGDAVNGPIIGATFKAIGFHSAVWNNLGGIDGLGRQEREEHLAKVRTILGQ